jgi:large subunit ribosomal protein L29
MKRKEFIAELKDLSEEQLKARGRELAEELMRLRFRKASRQLMESHKIGEARRQLARVKGRIAELRSSAGSV